MATSQVPCRLVLNRGASSRNFNIIVTIMAKGLKVNSLIGLAPLMLFLSSYIPLFGIVALRQFLSNTEYLNWAGFSVAGIMSFVTHFGIASLCMVFIIVGSIGTYFVFEPFFYLDFQTYISLDRGHPNPLHDVYLEKEGV